MTLDEVINNFEVFDSLTLQETRDDAILALALEVKKLKERVFLDELKADTEKVHFAEANGIVNNKVQFKRGDRVGRNGKPWHKSELGDPFRGVVLTISKGRVRVAWANDKTSWIKPSSLVKIA